MSTGVREFNIYRAAGVVGDGVEPVSIFIHDPLPEAPTSDDAYARFASEGAALAEAIWASCPGGTVDALLSALFAKKASQFRVTFPAVTA